MMYWFQNVSCGSLMYAKRKTFTQKHIDKINQKKIEESIPMRNGEARCL